MHQQPTQTLHCKCVQIFHINYYGRVKLTQNSSSWALVFRSLFGVSTSIIAVTFIMSLSAQLNSAQRSDMIDFYTTGNDNYFDWWNMMMRGVGERERDDAYYFIYIWMYDWQMYITSIMGSYHLRTPNWINRMKSHFDMLWKRMDDFLELHDVYLSVYCF